jgi:hypothetical protein
MDTDDDLSKASTGSSNEEKASIDSGKEGEEEEMVDEDDGYDENKDWSQVNEEEEVDRHKVKKGINDLVSFRNNLRTMMSLSETSTQHACDSFSQLEGIVSHVGPITKEVISEIARVNRIGRNISIAMPVIEEFALCLERVETERLKINQGPKTTIVDYLNRLEQFKGLQKFAWINTITYHGSKNAFSREKTLKSQYQQFLTIMQKGETILVQEFIGTI